MDLQVRLFLFYDHLPNIDLCFVLVSESEDDVISNLFMLVFQFIFIFENVIAFQFYKAGKAKIFRDIKKRQMPP